MAAPPVEGALVVSLDDLMYIVSNGRFISLVHVAVVNGCKHRIPVAYFHRLSEVGPAYQQACWEREESHAYACDLGDYLALKGKHGQKAPEMIKKGGF